MFVIFCLVAALGLVMNSLLMYMIGNNFKKMSTAELMMMHLSVTNMMQLVSRILTTIIPDQQGICYPMSFPCKITVLALCIARKGCMLFTIFLGLFRLLKVKNKPLFVLTNAHTHLALSVTWMILIVGCIPYVLLIPDNRPLYQNLTGTCTCSVLSSLTEKDLGLKIFDWVCGAGALYLVIAAMCFVSIKMVLILLKHQKTVFVDGTLNRSRTRQKDFTAIKGVVALMICYVTFSCVSISLRVSSKPQVFDIQRISADIYNVICPVILGYPYFKKLPCMSCHMQKREQVIAIS